MSRAIQRLSAATLIVLLAPVFLLIAALVVLDSGRPLIHREPRVGVGGRHFRILKFRTLHRGRENERLVAPPGDSRITRVGRFLRPSHLDELPQLFNILRGEMAFAGPRPARPELWRGVPPSLRERAWVLRPGLVSPASLDYIGEDDILAEYHDPETLYREVIFPAKVAADIAYFERRAAGSDLWVLLRMFGVVFLGIGRTRSRRRVRRLLGSAGKDRERTVHTMRGPT